MLLGAKLAGATLSDADLTEAFLRSADFSACDLRGARLDRASLEETNLRRADLRGASLERALLVNVDLEQADVTGARIYGVSTWDVASTGAIQKNLIITSREGPTITVDDIEIAQFVYLLLSREKLRKVIDGVTQRGVLILGRFGGGGLDLLQAIAAHLRTKDYLPMIFDFEGPSDRNYTETVKTLVGLSRFVIVDLSGPSVPQELYATVPHFKIPFAPIFQAGARA